MISKRPSGGRGQALAHRACFGCRAAALRARMLGAGAIDPHPNIVAIRARGVYGDQDYMVLELLEGGSLADSLHP